MSLDSDCQFDLFWGDWGERFLLKENVRGKKFETTVSGVNSLKETGHFLKRKKTGKNSDR